MPSPKPKLLFVVTEDWYFWMHRLALGEAALGQGFEVVVACRVQAHAARLGDAGFRVVALPWKRRGGTLADEVRTLWVLWRLFRAERPNIVHVVALKAIIYGGVTARLAGMRHRVATVAGLGTIFTKDSLRARLLRPPVLLALRLGLGGARVTLENPDDGDVLVAGHALRRAQVAVVASVGVDIARFAPADAGSQPPAPPLIVGMATRLVRDKGAAIVVAAMRRLRAEGVQVRFLLAGGVDDGSVDTHTRAEVEGWVREGLVEWLGHIDDVPGFWRRCHVAAYPSRYGEGVPKTLLEAAACGLAIVTTDRPGCREAAHDDVNGILVPVDDPASVAAALRRLAEDEALRRRLGEAGRARAEREFADPVVIAKMLSVYGVPAGG